MPPVRKFDRDSIIRASLLLIEKEGKSNFNARKLASYLGSSVQPIFHYFENMEDLEKCVYDRIYGIYVSKMLGEANDEIDSYKRIGLQYVRFAREHKEFFKMIFMQKTDFNSDDFLASGEPIDNIIESGRKFTGLSYDMQREFHKSVWIFTHGIACLVNTETVCLSDIEVEKLLTETVKSMLIGYKKGKMYEESN